MINILTIVGARPQFVKAAVVSNALSKIGIKEDIVHTGQHYDYEMSTVFWDELGLPSPKINLEVGSGKHGAQTGIMLTKLEDYILNLPALPNAILVYGDTNSTLAAALVASKLHIPIVHVEAGLRSFNKKMPEEINRIMTDHVSDILFCSSDEGVEQLRKEGITSGVFNVGDVMFDALLTFSKIAEKTFTLSDIIPNKKNSYHLATIHRPSNTDDEQNLEQIINAFSKLDCNVVWPVHPRNKSRLEKFDIPENLCLIDPVSYFKMMILLKNCNKVLTDSGGLQKEAYWMKKQCITVRKDTEWVETLEGGWNSLSGANERNIVQLVKNDPTTEWKNLYGNGYASIKIATAIKHSLEA
ncbi:MAG: UDP-N-acetylglucosamine 2-epimerase (non-hydrolyzing) [Balneolaceae bacterium]